MCGTCDVIAEGAKLSTILRNAVLSLKETAWALLRFITMWRD